jgi:hypothetical protein
VNESFIPLLHLTPALRAFLVNRLVSDEDAPEIALVLLEPEADREPPPEIRRRLKAKLNVLAQTPQGSEINLVTACEHIVQFALLRNAASELQQLNALLPEGLDFSPQSGRLLLELDRYRQGTIGQEDPHVYQLIAHAPLPTLKVPVHTPRPPSESVSEAFPPTAPDPQAQEALKALQGIRQRRMELLKKVRSEMHG